jgi:hypothetical protein
VAETEADLALLERLVRSITWREYREQVLLPAYGRVAQTLDVATSDHRYLQGLKEGLRLAMVEPYRLLQLPSPLEQPMLTSRRAQKTVPQAADTSQDEGLRAPPRPSYLA